MNNRRIHEAELLIAKYFIDICKKNHFNYFILGGTFLGAVRHKGFIPWDDDMDFGMPREDYEKLIQYLKDNPSKAFNLCSFADRTNRDYPIKIESQDLKLVDNLLVEERIRNVWIDIFPLDGVPTNFILMNVHKVKLLSLRALFKLSQLSSNVSVNNFSRTRIEKLIIAVGKLIKIEKVLNEEKLCNKLDEVLKKYSYEKSELVVNFMGAYKFKEMFPKKIYEETETYLFEDTYMTGPKDYDYVLTQMYGNYMTPPKDNEKNKHQTTIK